ncbi:MAG: hypothetical protein AAFV87_08865 [Pseudomonadota bacterium]
MQIDPDLMFVIGLLIGGFSIPSIFSAISDGRAPRASAITILLAFGCVLYAINNKPGGYTIDQVPEVFVEVISRFTG